MLSRARVTKIRNALTAWYRRHARDLPWRRTNDPYAVWLSEIMLQQTQVATAIPYYERFLKRFPTIDVLSRARLQSVLKAWEGLGYYTRARHLHEAARRIVRDHGGVLPQSAERLARLPGIGKYTAGAIASIAFDRNEPVLDGNVIRVLCRLEFIADNPKAADTLRRLWALAGTILPRGRAGMFNQALMDLGATVCVPRNPQCAGCPLRALCKAFAEDAQGDVPTRSQRRAIPHYDIGVAVVWRQSRILIAKRKPEGLLGGLWEFPGGKREKGESLEDCAVRETFEEVRVKARVARPFMTVRHAYSHFRVTLHAFECEYAGGRPKAVGCEAWKWVLPEKLTGYPFPRANRKILEALFESPTSISTRPARSGTP